MTKLVLVRLFVRIYFLFFIVMIRMFLGKKGRDGFFEGVGWVYSPYRIPDVKKIMHWSLLSIGIFCALKPIPLPFRSIIQTLFSVSTFGYERTVSEFLRRLKGRFSLISVPTWVSTRCSYIEILTALLLLKLFHKTLNHYF